MTSLSGGDAGGLLLAALGAAPRAVPGPGLLAAPGPGALAAPGPRPPAVPGRRRGAPGAAAALVRGHARAPDLLPIKVVLLLVFVLALALVLFLLALLPLLLAPLLLQLLPLVGHGIGQAHALVAFPVLREEALGGDAHEVLAHDEQQVRGRHVGPGRGRLVAARRRRLRGEELQVPLAADLRRPGPGHDVLPEGYAKLPDVGVHPGHRSVQASCQNGAYSAAPPLGPARGEGPLLVEEAAFSFLSCSFSSFVLDHTRTFNFSWNSRHKPISGNCAITACQFPRTQSLCRLASAMVARFRAHRNCARSFFLEQS
eukprot:SRR837773.21339.p1 GENE.SRR837773.21339~~SRR837773.21339.p1  ORF type:complete len:314 (+),score=62.91 SRR837773.21339:271-1212(+)